MKSARFERLLSVGLLAILAACGGGGGGGSSSTGGGGGGGGSTTPTVPPISTTEAYRFLNQATFGASESSAQALIAVGDNTNTYTRWIDSQVALPASTELAAVIAAYPNPLPANFNPASLHGARADTWLSHALTANDQLRLRVAFALSEIMVTSQIGALQDLPFAATDYYDMLARNALGDFRVLLEQVTLHPAMGVYLSMLGNQKANVATNIRPDENYAREVMQLMSIGLIELNMDGSPRLDGSGATIPTYNQNIIEGFARVFTGWKWACPSTMPVCNFTSARLVERAPVPNFNQVKPMVLYPEQHETGTKQVLSYAGAALTTIPANQSGTQDLKDALDNIFNHPNVPPFISKQLIQKLVTSNPSPAYIQRVAQIFANDGSGKRGNLAAVVRAILMDADARTLPAGTAAANFGKVKEPLLRILQFWRAYNAHADSGRVVVAGNFLVGGALSPSSTLGQGPLQSASVFNFFSPFYAPPGEIATGNMVAPELQLATEYLNTLATNQIYTYATARTTGQVTRGADVLLIDTTAEAALAADSTALVNRVADRLLGSNTLMSQTLRDQARAQVDRSAATAVAARVGDAIYLVATSPEYTVLK